MASLFSYIAKLANGSHLKGAGSLAKVTARELEIIGLIAEGLSDKEIAQHLCLETQTVKNHIHNILNKLHLNRRHEAVQYAYEKGLLRKALSEVNGKY